MIWPRRDSTKFGSRGADRLALHFSAGEFVLQSAVGGAQFFPATELIAEFHSTPSWVILKLLLARNDVPSHGTCGGMQV